MCGGIKNIGSLDYVYLIPGKVHNFDVLHSGQSYNLNLRFEGHCRSETFDRVWGQKARTHVGIMIDGFAERDTVHGNYQVLKPFKMPQGKMIAGVIMKDKTLRIITKKAVAPISDIHHRMPLIVDKENLAYA